MAQLKVEYGKFRKSGGDSTHLRRKLTEDAVVKLLKHGLFEDIYHERSLEIIMSLSFSYPDKKDDTFEDYFVQDLSLSYPKSKKEVLKEEFEFYEDLQSLSFSFPKAKILDEDFFFMLSKYSSLSYSYPSKAVKKKSQDNFDFLMDEYLSLSYSYPKKMSIPDHEIDLYQLEDFMSLSYSYPSRKKNEEVLDFDMYKVEKLLSFSYSYPNPKKNKKVSDFDMYELEKYLSLSYSYPEKKAGILNDVENSTITAVIPTAINSDVSQLPVPANVSNIGADSTVTSTTDAAQRGNFLLVGFGLTLSVLAVAGFVWRKHRLHSKNRVGN